MIPAPNLRLSLIQSDLHWEDKPRNLAMFDEKLADISAANTDLIILPEMFSTGFSMNPEQLSESMTGITVNWMKNLSIAKKLGVCGSFIAEDKGLYFNRFCFFEEGEVKHVYDKHHLFTMAGESEVYTSGTDAASFVFKGWKILPRICYDLRFPVWCRSPLIDLQIYVANWPLPRLGAWDKLLMARAIENQCYVAGVNRVGKDGNGHPYQGHSVVIDAKGELLTAEMFADDGVLKCSIDWKTLNDFREKFPLHLDADQFQILH